ncbi:MAG TPA: hypothetical protein VG253_16220 [Streptosporangiaceae bacterium]|nr:hypothetical protein [Streptosporangiaceae bacterium]
MTAAAELVPDVVLMDIRIPAPTASRPRQRSRRPRRPRVVALTTFDADELVRQAINAGSVGYLVKDTPRPRSSTRSGLALQGRVCCHRQ